MKRWDTIAKRCPAGKKIKGAEIGVYKCKMSRYLLELLPNLKLYMIDRWSEYNKIEIRGDKNSPMVHMRGKFWDDIFKKTLLVKKKYGGRAQILRMDSAEAVKRFENNYFYFVFLDADHSYNGVIRDIQIWLPKIKKGGFISGHDYTRRTVADAVNDFFGKDNIELDEDKTWFVRL